MRLALVAAAALGLGCAGSDAEVRAPAEVVAPAEPPTAGDALLALVPAGADAVLEIDVARLRANAAVGELVAGLGSGEVATGFDLAQRADTVVICAYGIGELTRQLVLVSGEGAGEVAGARRLGPSTIAVGPADLLARAEAARGGHEPVVAAEAEFLRLRGEAMPEGAPGASLRLAARLSFDARVELSGRLELASVPTALSVWGDVADDLAIVAVLRAADAADAADMARGLTALRDRLARTPAVAALGVAVELSRARVEAHRDRVRIVFTIGPRRLRALVAHLLARLGEVSS